MVVSAPYVSPRSARQTSPLAKVGEGIIAFFCHIERNLDRDLRQRTPLRSLRQQYQETYGITAEQFDHIYAHHQAQVKRQAQSHRTRLHTLKQQTLALRQVIREEQQQAKELRRLHRSRRQRVPDSASQPLQQRQKLLKRLEQQLKTAKSSQPLPKFTPRQWRDVPFPIEVLYHPPRQQKGDRTPKEKRLKQWSVQIQVPPPLVHQYGRSVLASNLKFPQGQKVILYALDWKRPLSFYLIWRSKRWTVYCLPNPQAISLKRRWERFWIPLANLSIVAIGIAFGLQIAGIQVTTLLQINPFSAQEVAAREHWNHAQQLADQAKALEGQAALSLHNLENVSLLWEHAVEALEEIPQETSLSDEATQALVEYKQRYQSANEAFRKVQSEALTAIVTPVASPAEVRLTICSFSGQCLNLNGDVPPASPASLIKIPVAISLMHKIHQDNIPIETVISIAKGNYTEEASEIRAGGEYSLKQLVGVMIDHSSNIATNQLMDYLGSNYINETLKAYGYTTTEVHYKMVGEKTFPKNPGKGSNQITSNELTEMMRQIYNNQHPGDDILIEALKNQKDLVLGHQGLEGTGAIWLGEKTGQNSKMLGTTVAMEIQNEGYIVTVMLNHSGNEAAIRHIVHEVALYIAKRGHL